MGHATLCSALMTLLLFAGAGHAADLLRIEDISVPRQAPAGATVPIEATFSVAETLRDGWRVGYELAHVDGKARYAEGPVNSQFNAGTPVGAKSTYSLTIDIPADAPVGKYRVIVDHYSNPDGEWVHVRYLGKDGKPAGVIVGEIEVVAPLAPLGLPAAQRKLRPGEIHAVYECEEFDGMDGNGEDLGVAIGWTWYAGSHFSGLRAAANNTGQGTIHTPIDPPLPPGEYKLFVKSVTTFSTVRVGLGEQSVEVTPLRAGWIEAGTVTTDQPTGRLWLEAINKIGNYVIIDSVYVTNDLTTEATRARVPSRQFLPADAKPAKQRRTIWTEEFVAAARERMKQHESVRKVAEGIIDDARKIAQNPDETLWQMLADTSIQRQYYVNQNKGCPVCGLKIKDYDVFHPWIFDPIKRPFKMECPSCHNVFPSNDFAAGEMEGGEYADDGTGCKIGEDTYNFIGEYVHFAYRDHFLGDLKTLSQAIALTDDAELAHKAGVMLLRAAQQYPNSEDRQERAFQLKWGHRSGVITDSIWSSYEGQTYGWAYDAVWPFLDGDEKLLELARAQVPGVETHEDLRLYIEESLLRRIGQAYCDEAIIGNPGYHHKGLAWLILALDDMDSTRFPNCEDLLEALYYRVYGALRYFPNLLGRDGSSLESTGYNASRLNMLDAIAILQRFFDQHPETKSGRYPDLWADPRFAAQFDYYTDYMLLDRWLPTVGDTGGESVIPERIAPIRFSVVGPPQALSAWDRYRTGKLAILAYGLGNTAPQPALWNDLPLDELAEARRAAPERLERNTNIQDDYGLVFLRSGEGEKARVLWGWYGQTLSHAHDDRLMIGLDGKQMDLLPDLGYPKSWDHAGRWESNSLTHNTVIVDGAAFPPGRNRGRLKLLGSVPGFQITEMETGDIAGKGELSRRLLALVDIDDEEFYAVDLFDVRAGSEHTLSYHGPQAKVTVEGVQLQTQEKGTVAGEDIEYGQPISKVGEPETHSPLAHMTEVQRGEPVEPYVIDYALGDELDTHLRLHQLPEADTSLALGTGRPPSQPDAYKVRYSLQQRSGPAPLAGRYVTVMEANCGQPVIESVTRPAKGGFELPEALIISHVKGRDVLLFGPAAESIASTEDATLTGRAGMVRFADGKPVVLSAYGFSSLEAGDVSVTADSAFLQGEVSSCDYPRFAIRVTGIPADESLVGMPVRIYNDRRSSLHIIAGVKQDAGQTELVLTTTALRHEGWVAAVSGGSIRNGAPSPWSFDTYLGGTRLVSEDGKSGWAVAAASGGWWSAPTGTQLVLRAVDGGPASAEALGRTLSDANGDGMAEFRVYEYGAGDKIEIASFMRLTRGDDGRWEGVMSPGVSVR